MFSSLGSLFGAKGGKGGKGGKGKGAFTIPTDEADQISMALRTLSGDYGLLDTTEPSSPMPNEVEDSGAAPKKKNYQIPMIYFDDKAPPKDAWGKKFNALPLGSEKGFVTNYNSVVSCFSTYQSLDTYQE